MLACCPGALLGSLMQAAIKCVYEAMAAELCVLMAVLLTHPERTLPHQTYEMISEWEDVQAATLHRTVVDLAARQKALVKITAMGQSIAYFFANFKPQLSRCNHYRA